MINHGNGFIEMSTREQEYWKNSPWFKILFGDGRKRLENLGVYWKTTLTNKQGQDIIDRVWEEIYKN
jgi:hypothetical protein